MSRDGPHPPFDESAYDESAGRRGRQPPYDWDGPGSETSPSYDEPAGRGGGQPPYDWADPDHGGAGEGPREAALPRVGPFVRLARVHAAATATDAVVAAALAGSIFFSISPDAARWRVALYLGLTMAPFAVVTPLIGPAIDRMPGGRRAMIFVTTFGRCAVALLLVFHIDTLWLFPEAFALLVLQKGYAVAKSAVVPHCVTDEADLVEANSRLALVSALMSVIGFSCGGLLVWLISPSWAAGLAAAGYAVAVAFTFPLPRVSVAPKPPTPVEKAALRTITILLSGSAMAILRGVVGFVTFVLLFDFRGGDEGLDVSAAGAAMGGAAATVRGIDISGDPGSPAWHFGAVGVAAGAGVGLGALVAPHIRQRFAEESIMLGALVLGCATALLGALAGGLTGAVLLSLGIAISAAVAKLAFDSLVQRDAPDANHGRFFSRFEARFQIAWVAGAFAPAVIPIPARIGSLLAAMAVGFALFSYLLGRSGRRSLRPRRPEPKPAEPAAGGDTGADDGEVTAEEIQATQPAAPAGLSELTVLAAGDPPPPEDYAEPGDPTAGPDPTQPPPPWWTDPLVSTVDGVEIEEDRD